MNRKGKNQHFQGQSWGGQLLWALVEEGRCHQVCWVSKAGRQAELVSNPGKDISLSMTQFKVLEDMQ